MKKYLVPIYNRTRRSEAEIQADIYCSIKQLGLDPRLEVRGFMEDDPVRKKCFFDVVVFWPLNHRPVCIIECKKGKRLYPDSPQMKRYKRFGLPVLVCGKDSHDEILKRVMEISISDYHHAPPSFSINDFWTVKPPE